MTMYTYSTMHPLKSSLYFVSRGKILQMTLMPTTVIAPCNTEASASTPGIEPRLSKFRKQTRYYTTVTGTCVSASAPPIMLMGLQKGVQVNQ